MTVAMLNGDGLTQALIRTVRDGNACTLARRSDTELPHM